LQVGFSGVHSSHDAKEILREIEVSSESVFDEFIMNAPMCGEV